MQHMDIENSLCNTAQYLKEYALRLRQKFSIVRYWNLIKKPVRGEKQLIVCSSATPGEFSKVALDEGMNCILTLFV